MTKETTKEERQSAGLIDLEEWVMDTPFGPMRHVVTGETYQGREARLSYEAQKMKAANAG